MSRKQDFIDVLQHRIPERVPLWELHFHLWSKLSDGEFISGKDFMALSDLKKDLAICRDAEIIVQWSHQLGFGAVSIPDPPWDCVYTMPQPWRLRLIEELKKLDPDFCILGSCGGVICMPSSSDDYMNFCYKLFDEPEEVDEDCRRMYEGFLENSARMRDAGADGVYIASDMADTRSQFFTDEQMERWYYPYLTKCADRLREIGMFSILHTDGNIGNVLDGFRCCRIDALQAIDPVAGMDLGKVKEALQGEIAVCGNFDCGLMLTGTPDDIYAAAEKLLLDNKAGGGLVFGNTNAVDIQTPVANYLAFVEAWKKNSVY